MTEARKEIINIIEPYMDKSLEIWCYLQDISRLEHRKEQDNYKDSENFDVDLIIMQEYDKTFDCYEFSNIPYSLKKEEIEQKYKILWHYDITAVLKCIRCLELINKFAAIIVFEDRFWIIYKGKKYTIPNKPLHLYSDTEEKHLLDLLKNYAN